eukprot:321802-Pleurochrysis_carterae.AAC.1
MGENARANQYQHLRDDFVLYATRYAKMLPHDESPPKMHGLCSHMSQQMRSIGGTGFLSESVVETIQVEDNRMMSRYACVKNLEDQQQCRARAN